MIDESPNRAGLKILIAEDERIVAEDIALTLQDLGYQAAGIASTGESAVELARQTKPALVLMDVRLAGDMDGIEASEQIRAQLDVPVVFLTGYAEGDTLSRAKKAEPYGYLTKPFSHNILKVTIETALYKHSADKRVRESEARRAKAQELAGLHGWEWDMLTGSLFWSAESNRVFGFNCEVKGIPIDAFINFVHVEDRNLVKSAIQEALAGVRPYDLEYRIVQPNGQERFLHSRGEIVRDATGQPVRMWGMALDITERKKSEAARRQSEERFRMVYESGMVGMGFCEPDGRISDANDAYLAMIGRSRDDLLNNRINWREITPPEHLPADHNGFDELMAKGRCTPYEKEYLLPDGSRVPVIIGGALMTSNSSTAIAFALDNTERKKAEKALQESKERFRQLSDVTFEGIVFHDRGVLLEANEQFFAMMGYKPDELLGTQTIEKLVSPESQETVRSRIAAGSTEPYEIMGLRKDGSKIPLEVRVKPQRVGGREIRAVALRDISEQKEMERRLIVAQKMEAVGRLAGGVSHDFNNLLQIISGNAELLEAELAQRGLRFPEVSAISGAAKRGADLVKKILTFSRRVDAKFGIIDLNEEVKNAESLLYRTIPKMFEIELDLATDLWPIRADSAQIEQALINLAVNARDAMSDRGKISISTENVEVKGHRCRLCDGPFTGRYVLLRVSDTGHGMNQVVLQRIFEPFFTTKGPADGTGLGLSTVYGIVRIHEAHIECETEIGKGTSFSIYFPVGERCHNTQELLKTDT